MAELNRQALIVLVPNNWTNDQRGDFFETIVGDVLSRQRWKVQKRVRVTGMEIDLLCDHRFTNDRALVQCKFMRESIGSPPIHLLLGQTVTLDDITHAFFVSTSPLGKEARGLVESLKSKKRKPPLVFLGPDELLEEFVELRYAPRSTVDRDEPRLVESYLILAPNMPRFWLHEFAGSDSKRRLMVETDRKHPVAIIEVRDLLREHALFQDLEIALLEDINDIDDSKPAAEPPRETVGLVPMAEAIYDYQPCKPADFIGRADLIGDVVRFVEQVRKSNARSSISRVVTLTGPSGFGKSSIVLKLCDRFLSKYWRRRVFCVPVDTRSARGRAFVSSALAFAVERAHQEGFLTLEKLVLPSEPPFAGSPGFQELTQELDRDKKVLLIFFDQFEEILTKDELRGVFDVIKRLVHDVHSEQCNLMIGFSWRTGIVLSEDNPAYHVWHGLADLRKQFEVGRFSDSETSALIKQFEQAQHYGGRPVLLPLRKRMIEQAQGRPWLAKKLAIHVFQEIAAGRPEVELLHGKLNIKALFDVDLGALSKTQNQCLIYIASNSPAEIGDVVDSYGEETLSSLVERRLVVRTGAKIAVYWDIFRDYLTQGAVPGIGWTWFPISPVSAALEVLNHLIQNTALDLAELAKRAEYREGTVGNILSDLQNLALVRRLESGQYAIVEDIGRLPSTEDIALFVSRRLVEHVVITELHSMLREGGEITLSAYEKVVKAAATGRSDKAMDGYVKLLSGWLEFAGLIEISANVVSRPHGRGRQFGIARVGRGRLGFQAASEPANVVAAARRLRKGSLRRDQVSRNAAQDLIAVQLAYYDKTRIAPTEWLQAVDDAGAERLVFQRAMTSSFMRAFAELRSKNAHSLSLEDEGLALASALERKWSAASARRYAGAAKRWWAAWEASNR